MNIQLQNELNVLALETKLNYEKVLISQYTILAQKHGVRLTLEESKSALKAMGYID